MLESRISLHLMGRRPLHDWAISTKELPDPSVDPESRKSPQDAPQPALLRALGHLPDARSEGTREPWGKMWVGSELGSRKSAADGGGLNRGETRTDGGPLKTRTGGGMGAYKSRGAWPGTGG